jgi:hypothetical protein
LKAFCTVPVLIATRLLTLQVTHHSAVKSTKTCLPSARCFAMTSAMSMVFAGGRFAEASQATPQSEKEHEDGGEAPFHPRGG